MPSGLLASVPGAVDSATAMTKTDANAVEDLKSIFGVPTKRVGGKTTVVQVVGLLYVDGCDCCERL